mgnify:CR=1 FL=1
MPGAHLEVIPRAGHVVMVDAAVTFNDLVLEFIDRPISQARDSA